MDTMENLKRILEDLENAIDLEHITKTEERLKKCLRFEDIDELCVKVSYPNTKYTYYSMPEIHSDIKKMMYNELVFFARRVELHDCFMPMIRPNYGVGVVPSVFGLKSRIVDNNMPWVDHADADTVKKILKNGVPDFRNGYGALIIETYEFFAEMLAKYPKCQKAIRIYSPDHQGPFDIAHLIYGSDIYLDLYDDPELIHELLALVTETYIDTVKHTRPYLTDITPDGFNGQWGNLFPGSFVIRNDSAVNLSPSMYLEFVKPYDDKLTEALGAASMHYCGRGDQWIHEMARSEGILGYNFGHVPNIKYGMDFLDYIKPSIMDKGKPVISYVLEDNEIDTMDFNKYKTGITYEISAKSLDDAKRLLEHCNSKLK